MEYFNGTDFQEKEKGSFTFSDRSCNNNVLANCNFYFRNFRRNVSMIIYSLYFFMLYMIYYVLRKRRKNDLFSIARTTFLVLLLAWVGGWLLSFSTLLNENLFVYAVSTLMFSGCFNLISFPFRYVYKNDLDDDSSSQQDSDKI